MASMDGLTNGGPETIDRAEGSGRHPTQCDPNLKLRDSYHCFRVHYKKFRFYASGRLVQRDGNILRVQSPDDEF